jgi:uncharacterized repeat protein (TIGR03803 family)
MIRLSGLKTAGAVCVLCAPAALVSPAQTLKTRVVFSQTNGANPDMPPIQGLDGDLYGTTADGGVNGGGGTVFKITPIGALTMLHSFCAQINCTDGADPSGLVLAADGHFYGTTNGGGLNYSCSFNGCGTVFNITSSGTFTSLHNFDGGDGSAPFGGLLSAADGNFYGTTSSGGANDSCSLFGYAGCGTVFKITPDGTLTTLHSFDDTDGEYPSAALAQDRDGNLYGTTSYGGSGKACVDGCGTVFKITPDGALTTVYSFNGTDGANPAAALVLATDGDFYGTTPNGGTEGYGTVFKITPGGKLTTLHNFPSDDGSNPEGGLVQATDGNLYGTTTNGGSSVACPYGCGTIFKISEGGTLTTLLNFDYLNGDHPVGALFQATHGAFFGTTFFGGGNDNGTIFSLSVGLGPFVETLPISGKVGMGVGILGNNLKGATSVTFNGTPAAFTVESGSLIKTTVPTGATTGRVQVVTPTGTLSSNVPFRVAP